MPPSRTPRTSPLNGQLNFVNLYNKSKYLKKDRRQGAGAAVVHADARPAPPGPDRAGGQEDEDKEKGKVDVLEDWPG